MERVSGIVIALLVNLLLGWLLLRATDMGGGVFVRDTSALQVVWIDAAAERVVNEPQASVPKRSPPRVDSAAARNAGRSPASTVPDVVAATDVSEVGKEGAEEVALPLDLTLAGSGATTRMEFARSNAARPSADAFAAQDRLDVEVRDRSVGGSLARMAQASDCAELRAAMRDAAAGGAGLDVILKSMQARGCR